MKLVQGASPGHRQQTDGGGDQTDQTEHEPQDRVKTESRIGKPMIE